MPLDPQSLQHAIDDLADLARDQHELTPEMFQAVAADHGIRSDVLQARFHHRYPNGDVGPAPETAHEIARRRVAEALDKVLKVYGEYAQIDGREILIDSDRYTVITENASRKLVIVFHHTTMEVRRISHASWKKLSVKKVPPSR